MGVSIEAFRFNLVQSRREALDVTEESFISKESFHENRKSPVRGTIERSELKVI